MLENAQNAIYAKELFNQILREAFELQTQLRPLIIGNSIKLNLLYNIDFIISLEHSNNLNSNDDNETFMKKKKFLKTFVSFCFEISFFLKFFFCIKFILEL